MGQATIRRNYGTDMDALSTFQRKRVIFLWKILIDEEIGAQNGALELENLAYYEEQAGEPYYAIFGLRKSIGFLL